MSSQVTDRIVEFALRIESEVLPEHVRKLATRLVTDCVGVMVAGSSTEVGHAIARHVHRCGGTPRARVVADGAMVPAGLAALANGTLAHALDLDDDEPLLMVGHPSAPVLSALLSLCHELRPPGRALIAAFVAGVETEIAIGRMVNPRHYDEGWHATSTLGTLGATVACARLRRLDRDATKAALGIAASSASGLKRNFGTMAKPLHVGRAAEAAVLATDLAADRFSADLEVLDGPFGLPAVFGASDPDTSGVDALGVIYALDRPGVAIKLYPSCSNTHPAIDALLELRADGALDCGISSIVCHVAPGTERMLQYDVPTTALEGKFSMPYCLAVAAVHGAPEIAHFSDGAIADPRVRQVMERVRMVPDPGLVTSELGVSTSATVSVTDLKGTTREHTAWHPRGSRTSPLTDSELWGKFERCCEPLLGGRAEALFDRLLRLECEPDVASVIDHTVIS